MTTKTSRTAKPGTTPNGMPPFEDPFAVVESDPAFMGLAADLVGDLEHVRIANENRFRQLTRTEEDADGQIRGLGLDLRNPFVMKFSHVIEQLAAAEHEAILGLQGLMRKHPLGPYVKATPGLGEKQVARLLAATGDPYIRPTMYHPDGTVEPSRPRRVSELWALCGYHVLLVHHPTSDTQAGHVNENGDSDHINLDNHDTYVGVAPKRTKGQRANWSSTAKMRAYLIAESCVKVRHSPFRKVYDDTRTKYADAVHKVPCVRCGPKGKPAVVGSPLSDGHKHARALRAVAKEVLRELWRESKRLHEGENQ